jgi:hypothetical protein
VRGFGTGAAFWSRAEIPPLARFTRSVEMTGCAAEVPSFALFDAFVFSGPVGNFGQTMLKVAPPGQKAHKDGQRSATLRCRMNDGMSSKLRSASPLCLAAPSWSMHTARRPAARAARMS